jgi:hypothetical protein
MNRSKKEKTILAPERLQVATSREQCHVLLHFLIIDVLGLAWQCRDQMCMVHRFIHSGQGTIEDLNNAIYIS